MNKSYQLVCDYASGHRHDLVYEGIHLQTVAMYTVYMAKIAKKLLLANTFGTLGYLFCVLLWGWMGIIYLPMILGNEHVEKFLMPTPSEQVAATPTVSAELSPILMGVAVIVTVIVMVITIVVLIRMPVTIAKTGKTITTKAASSTLPLIARNQPIKAAEKRRLTAGLIKLAKMTLITLPVGLTLFGKVIELPLDFDLVLIISSLLAMTALIWFSLQYITARAFQLDIQKLV